MTNKIYEEDYKPNPLTDDDKMYHIKSSLKCLNTVQKMIFILYAEAGSFAGLARELKVSTPTAKAYINKIKSIIYECL